MAGFNPCYCWNLKDGCVTIGIWTLMFSLTQLGLFGWQTYILSECRVVLFHDFLNCQDYCPCARNRDVKRTQDIIQGLFVIQILNLIAAFFLLFASVALIYGIHTNSKYLVWPWFPCIVAAIVCSLAYCVMWWAGDVTGYWLVLTVVEVLAVMINLYCLFCVIVQYRRIVRGYLPASENDSLKNQQVLGYEYPYSPRAETGVVTYAPEKKVGEGVWNTMYEPEYSPQQRVKMYAGKEAYGRAPNELVTYTQPVGAGLDETPNEPFPRSKSDMTEEWLHNVMKSQPEEPKIPVLDHPPSPGKERPYHRSKSLDALEKEERDKRRSMRTSKSKESVSSKHSRRGRRDSSCSTCTSSETETGTRKGRSRSDGRHRHGYDSEDTGYSRSVADSERKHKKHRHHRSHHTHHDSSHRKHRSHSHGHTHHKHKDEERRSRKRLRDVKREDKERRQLQQDAQAPQQVPAVQPVRPDTTSADRGRLPVGAVPVWPGALTRANTQAAAISIPQHIVIPPQPKGTPHQPQRFHINSEITISYSDRSAPVSDSERPLSGGPTRPSLGPVIVPAPTPSPASGPIRQTPLGPSARADISNALNSSSDSGKGYGSTAV